MRLIKSVLILMFAVNMTARAENPFLNSSFEAGNYGWQQLFQAVERLPEAKARFEIDRITPTAAKELGSASLKITWDEGVMSATLASAVVPIKEGRKYTVSFYAKAAQPVTITLAATAPGLSMGVRPIIFIERNAKPFQLTADWQRYSAKFKAVPSPNPGPWDRKYADICKLAFELYVANRPGTNGVWLDGIQLSETESAAYEDNSPVTVGAQSPQPANIYKPGEKIEPAFYFYRSKAAGPPAQTSGRPTAGNVSPPEADPPKAENFSVNLSPLVTERSKTDDNAAYQAAWRTEECLTGKIVGEKVMPLKFESDNRLYQTSFPYPISSDRQGVFKTTVEVSTGGRKISDCEFIHAVYNPLPVPQDFEDDSVFAMDHPCSLGGATLSIDEYFRLASEIGMRSYRDETRMDAEAPEAGKYTFEADSVHAQCRGSKIKTAEKYKIRPMICIGPETEGYLPHWIRSDQLSKTRYYYENYDPNGKILPQYDNDNGRKLKLDGLADYCYQLALHFKGRVKYYEVFNERSELAEYPEYVRTVYEAVKKADPDAKIMPNYIKRLPSANDAAEHFGKLEMWKYCDAVSQHIYATPIDNGKPEENIPSFQEYKDDWQALFDKVGKPKMELLETEGGHSSPSYYTYMQPGQKGNDPRPGMLLQAMRSQRKWIMFQDIGFKKYFYFLFNGYGVTGWYASLLEFNDTPKLSYLATGNAARLITGAKSLGRIQFENSKVWGYQFQPRVGGRFVTLWNIEETPIEFIVGLPKDKLRAEDMLGNPLPLAGDTDKTTIPISGAPVYLFGKAIESQDAKKVNEIFAKGIPVGLVPVAFATELVGNPETGEPAMAVLAKNVSGREFNGIFHVAGLPPGWQAESDRTAIGGLPAKETGAGYVDIKCPQSTSSPIFIKAFYENNGKMMEVSRRIPRVTLIARKSGEIKIDGNPDEPDWTQAVEKIEINKKEQVALELEPKTLRNRTELDRTNIIDWKGPESFSSVHRALWDDEALYIAARVITSNVVQKRRDRTIFNSSCIELFLSLDSAANAWDPLYKKSDYHLLFSPASDDVPTCMMDAVHDQHDAKYSLKITPEVASRKVENGYEMEIKIPWKNFKETEKIKTGQTFGLDIAVDAAFPDGNRQWQMVWCGGQDSCATPVNFARAILVEKAAPKGTGQDTKEKSAKEKEYLKIAEKDGFSSKAYNLVPEKQALLAYDPVNYAEGWQSLRLENRADTVPRERGVGVFIENALKNAVFTEIISEPFELEAGKTYLLSFWASSDAGLLSAWFAVVPEGYKAEPITDQFYKGKSWPYETVVETGKTWKKYTLQFTVPKETQGPYRQRVRYTDKAVLWLDELNIKEVQSK